MSKLYVYKYPLNDEAHTELDLPAGAQLLRVDAQGTKVMLWGLVDPSRDVEPRRILVLGTGHWVDIPEQSLRHINTFLIDGGVFVFHAFELVAA